MQALIISTSIHIFSFLCLFNKQDLNKNCSIYFTGALAFVESDNDHKSYVE